MRKPTWFVVFHFVRMAHVIPPPNASSTRFITPDRGRQVRLHDGVGYAWLDGHGIAQRENVTNARSRAGNDSKTSGRAGTRIRESVPARGT
jgi:hypothetical protein